MDKINEKERRTQTKAKNTKQNKGLFFHSQTTGIAAKTTIDDTNEQEFKLQGEISEKKNKVNNKNKKGELIDDEFESELDTFCEDLDEEADVTFTNWVNLLEAKLSGGKTIDKTVLLKKDHESDTSKLEPSESEMSGDKQRLKKKQKKKIYECEPLATGLVLSNSQLSGEYTRRKKNKSYELDEELLEKEVSNALEHSESKMSGGKPKQKKKQKTINYELDTEPVATEFSDSLVLPESHLSDAKSRNKKKINYELNTEPVPTEVCDGLVPSKSQLSDEKSRKKKKQKKKFYELEAKPVKAEVTDELPRKKKKKLYHL